MNLFNYADYRKYLRDALPTVGPKRGGRSQLAEILGCQLGFVSLVFTNKAHFSLEHALLISDFLGHTQEEQDFFILLVQKERAGSKKLEIFFEKKISQIKETRKSIANRVDGAVKALSEIDQATYYSHWCFIAIHMALLVPELQTRDALKKYFQIPTKRLNEIIEFLIKTSLAIERGSKLQTGTVRMHLPANSPLINRHHMNWRMQTIAALDEPLTHDLHYSAIISISETVASQIRELLMNTIVNADTFIMNAKDESVYALGIDLYSLDQSKR